MSVDAQKSILQTLQEIRKRATQYFEAVLQEFPQSDGYMMPHDYRDELSVPLKGEATAIAGQLASLAQQRGQRFDDHLC
jgi:hypothetical protein